MFATYERLGVSIWASDRAVIRAARKKLKRTARNSRKHRVARHMFYRQMLSYHADARGLARDFRL